MASNYLADISLQLGIPLVLLIIIIVWELVWKIISMWKAAKNNSSVWFVALLIVNSVGILPILYVFIFSKLGKRSRNIPKKKIPKRRR